MRKFFAAIGNPPYNDEFGITGDNETYAPPVYHNFIDAACEIADKVELIHPARFLFNAGRTPKNWNDKMLNDPHFKVMEYIEDATSVFGNTDIKGGVAITYHDASKDFGAIQVFTKFPELNNILHKTPVTPEMLPSLFYVQTKFNLDALYKDHPDYAAFIGGNGSDKRFRSNSFTKVPVFFDEAEDPDDVRVLGVINNKRCFKYIAKDYVDVSQPNLYKWTAVIPTASGTGTYGEVITAPVVLGPGEGYTQTFIGVGAFDTEDSAESMGKYLKTKYVRALMGLHKTTQHITPEVFCRVPLQDFTSASDIDWSCSIAKIDQQLYKKYGLSDEEIQFIETHVKEMN